MDEEIPASAKDAAKIAFLSSIIIGIILIAGVLWYFFHPKTTTPATVAISPTIILSPTSAIAVTQPPRITPQITNSQGTTETYTSKRLGVSFTYSKKAAPDQPDNTETINVKESGNKIMIYPSSLPADQGQSIEVFDKAANETVEDAIRRQILSGKDPKRCLITTSQKQTRTTAEITFPTSQNEDVEVYFANSAYCSVNYAQTNGLRYFMYDPATPTKFYFLSIGQYGIRGENGMPWQDSLKVFN